MTDWTDLERELDDWGGAGHHATFWWRDDDAVTASPALDRLLATTAPAAGPAVPLSLAVIPALADSGLAQALHAAAHAVALQHGYAHTNQAGAAGKKAEFGVGRDSALAVQELRKGSLRMRALFADRALPVLVPPWNRIDPALTARLSELGIRGLSTYGPRQAKMTAGGIIVANTHVDIIDWHGGRRFLGTEQCLQLAIRHLAARRAGQVDASEPTGLLTHHLVHDAEAWSFLQVFLQRTSRHPAMRWVDARQLFSCSNQAPA